EKDPAMREKLDTFRDKAKQKMVQFWTSPEELATKISTSLHSLIKNHPAEGWVKARYVSDAKKDAPDLEQLSKMVANTAARELSLDEEDLKNHGSLISQPDAGLVKLYGNPTVLERVGIRGGGAYFD